MRQPGATLSPDSEDDNGPVYSSPELAVIGGVYVALGHGLAALAFMLWEWVR